MARPILMESGGPVRCSPAPVTTPGRRRSAEVRRSACAPDRPLLPGARGRYDRRSVSSCIGQDPSTLQGASCEQPSQSRFPRPGRCLPRAGCSGLGQAYEWPSECPIAAWVTMSKSGPSAEGTFLVFQILVLSTITAVPNTCLNYYLFLTICIGTCLCGRFSGQWDVFMRKVFGSMGRVYAW